MRAAKLSVLGGLAAAVLAAAWLQRNAEPGLPGGALPPAAVAPAAPRSAGAALRAPDDSGGAIAVPVRGPAVEQADAALHSKLAEKAYARLGGALVDNLVEHGLARSDGERLVRQFFADSSGCFLEALRLEAEAQSVAYDSLLDALEAELYDADGPLLTAVIDVTAVQTRSAPCELTAAEQAGLLPAILLEAVRDLNAGGQ